MNKNAQRLVLVIVAIVLLVFAVMPLWDYVTYRMAIASYSGYIAKVSGILPVNKYLLDLVATVFASAQVFAWSLILRSYLGGIFGFPAQKRRHALGFLILFCLAVGEKLSFYELTRNIHFNPKTGESMVFYCVTRAGVEWMPEAVYCSNGRLSERLTPENSDNVEMLSKGTVTRLCPPHGGFFNAYTSQPEVWYSRNKEECEFFNLPGYNPTTGERLMPVGRNIEDDCLRSLQKCRSEGVAVVPAEPPPVRPEGTDALPRGTEIASIPPAEPPLQPTAPAVGPVPQPPPARTTRYSDPPQPRFPPRPKRASLQGVEITLRLCRYRDSDLRCEVEVENRSRLRRHLGLGSRTRAAAHVESRGFSVEAASSDFSAVDLLPGGSASGSLEFHDIPPAFVQGRLVLTVDLGFTQADVGFPMRSVWVEE